MSQFSNNSTDALAIRLLSPSDIPAAMKLKNMAGWNQTESDWRRLLEAEPVGCFAASAGERVIATTTVITYGKALAWIGMVLVDPEYRRRGIATSLMRRALGYLRGLEVRTVKLDATPAGRKVYEGLGFQEESLVERWQGRIRPVIAPAAESLTVREAIDEQGAADIISLDGEAFGADRSRLLRSLLAESIVSPLTVLAAGGEVRGYALAREGTNACYLGPIVARDANAASALLDRLLAKLEGKEAFADLNTAFDGGREMLASRGMTKQRDLIRMRRGEESSAGTSPLVFAIAGPEIG